MENQNYEAERKNLEGQVIGYKIVLRRANPDKETARDLYGRLRRLERLAA